MNVRDPSAMPRELQNEADVLAAVRRLQTACVSGKDLSDAKVLLVAETSRLSLNNLDAWERKIRWEIFAVENPHARPWERVVRRTVRFPSWPDLCSGDGFRREHILLSLAEGAPNGFLFSLALRRLNDWVPQVRAAARLRLVQIAKLSDFEAVVNALWYALAHCGSWGRMEDADRVVLAQLIAMKNVALALKSRIIEAAAGPATRILAQAGRTPALDEWLGEFARSATQPAVRAKAYRSLFEARMVWDLGRKWIWTDLKWCKGRFEPVLGERAIPNRVDLLENLASAMADASPLVRRVAAEFLIRELQSVGPEATRFAEQLASDRSAYVAERGRFALAALEKTGDRTS